MPRPESRRLSRWAGAQGRFPRREAALSLPYSTTAFSSMTRRYQRALSFQMRAWVSKST